MPAMAPPLRWEPLVVAKAVPLPEPVPVAPSAVAVLVLAVPVPVTRYGALYWVVTVVPSEVRVVEYTEYEVVAAVSVVAVLETHWPS